MSDTTTPTTLPAETAPAPYQPWRDKKVILTAALAVVLAVLMALTALGVAG